MSIKITPIHIENCNDNIFGDWINDDTLYERFIRAKPFEHIIIDNFLRDDYVESVYKQYPTNLEEWWKYWNPIEVKYANDNINNMPDIIRNIFYALSTQKMIQKIAKITGIRNLEYDKFLHGAGLHCHPRYGRLHMHLDYEKHPISNKERRLNIILYLSKKWKSEWNGDTQLWDRDMSQCVKKCHIRFNRAIIFKTNDLSWHGLPEKILCPEGVYRKSLAYYYVSPLESKPSDNKIGANDQGYRTKATFVKRPEDRNNNKINYLYQIRPYRRINNEDLKKHWSDWDYTKD